MGMIPSSGTTPILRRIHLHLHLPHLTNQLTILAKLWWSKNQSTWAWGDRVEQWVGRFVSNFGGQKAWKPNMLVSRVDPYPHHHATYHPLPQKWRLNKSPALFPGNLWGFHKPWSEGRLFLGGWGSDQFIPFFCFKWAMQKTVVVCCIWKYNSPVI